MLVSETLGNILTDDTSVRDAIHIAICSVTASEELSAGEHIAIINEDFNIAGKSENPIGIVDPYLKTVVQKGQMFWMFLYPNTITSLKHVWTHPSFDSGASQRWLDDFANSAGLSYHEILEAAKDYLGSNTYLCDGGRWEGFYTPDEFWVHYEIVTGEKVPEEERGNFFTCSC